MIAIQVISLTVKINIDPLRKKRLIGLSLFSNKASRLFLVLYTYTHIYIYKIYTYISFIFIHVFVQYPG